MAIPFITYVETENGEKKYYILQKAFPHNVAIVCYQPNPNPIAQSTIAGYNLWLVWQSTLRGRFIAAYPDYEKDLQGCMDSMALWFYEHRILIDEKRYAKFKIKNNV